MFLNGVKIMLFVSDIKYYIPIKLCKTAGSICLFKHRGTLPSENVKLKRNKIWDIIEIDWKGVKVTLKGKKISKSVTIEFQARFKIRHPVKREPLYLTHQYL